MVEIVYSDLYLEVNTEILRNIWENFIYFFYFDCKFKFCLIFSSFRFDERNSQNFSLTEGYLHSLRLRRAQPSRKRHSVIILVIFNPKKSGHNVYGAHRMYLMKTDNFHLMFSKNSRPMNVTVR